VGPGETGDRIQEDHDVPAILDETLSPLDGELRDLGVLLGGTIEGRVDHLTFDRTLHVGHFFRPFVDEDDHEVTLGVVRGDRVGDVLEDRRLTGLRRRDDEPTLALADRSDEIDDPGHDVVGLAVDLEAETHIGEQRGELGELAPIHGFFGIRTVDGDRTNEGGELLLGAGGTDRARDDVALAELGFAHHVDRDIGIVVPGEIPGAAEEPVTLGEDVEDALASLELGLVDRFLLPAAAPPTASSTGATLLLATVTLFAG
jgi:hypothetical protein